MLKTVLCNLLLSQLNSWTTTVETGVFPTWSMLRSHLENNWGDPVSCQLRVEFAWEAVKIGPEHRKLKNLNCSTVRSRC
jgi:hypothetical protein